MPAPPLEYVLQPEKKEQLTEQLSGIFSKQGCPGIISMALATSLIEVFQQTLKEEFARMSEPLDVEKVVVANMIYGIRQKYITAELKHYKKTKEKSKTLRAKVSVLDELLNTLGCNNR